MLNISIVRLFGVSMHAWTMEETVQTIRKRLEDGLFTRQVVVSAGKLANMQSDPALAESVLSCDIINIDGAGVVVTGRMLGLKIPERVAGIDLFLQLLTMAEKYHHSVYFLGAEAEIIEETFCRIRRDHPQLEIAGYHHGYFWDDEAALVRDIAVSGADMLFVGISSPKKENFINKWNADLGVKFVMGVGGTFDVMAGKVKRAPLWMQNWALEWVFRVMQEPRRLWKRYLITNSKFICMVIKGFFDQDYRVNGNIKQKKVMAVASGGGHWVQLLRLQPSFENHKVCYVTTIEGNKATVPGKTCYIVKEATRWNKFGLLLMLIQIMAIMIRVRPDVVITTGAASGVFAIRIGKLLGARSIWIDSMANVDELSLSGKIVGPHADLWLTQWEDLERKGGPFYKGNVF